MPAMKKVLCIMCIFFLFFAGEGHAFAGTYATEKMRCLKIKDRAARALCYKNAYKKRELHQAKIRKVHHIMGKNRILFCRLKIGTAAKKACERAAKKVMEQEKNKEKKQQKMLFPQKKNTSARDKEIFLRILPCAQKKTRFQKLICYNEFHKEKMQKKIRTKNALPEWKRRQQCQKIRNRKERNLCYQRQQEEEREKKEREREKMDNEFDERAAHAACLAKSNPLQRAKCFHSLSKYENKRAKEEMRGEKWKY